MALPGKPYELTFDERPNYLFARVSAKVFSPEIALAYLREVILESRELNYDRVLIVRDLPVMLSPSKNKYVSSQLADIVFDGLKIAVVEQGLDNDQQISFSEAASRGFGIEVKLHSTIPDARRWLLHDQAA